MHCDCIFVVFGCLKADCASFSLLWSSSFSSDDRLSFYCVLLVGVGDAKVMLSGRVKLRFKSAGADNG